MSMSATNPRNDLANLSVNRYVCFIAGRGSAKYGTKSSGDPPSIWLLASNIQPTRRDSRGLGEEKRNLQTFPLPGCPRFFAKYLPEKRGAGRRKKRRIDSPTQAQNRKVCLTRHVAILVQPPIRQQIRSVA